MKTKKIESARNKARREAREAAKLKTSKSEGLFQILFNRLGFAGMQKLEERLSKTTSWKEANYEVRKIIFETNPPPTTHQEMLESIEVYKLENYYFNVLNEDPSPENARYKFTPETLSNDLKAFASRYDVSDTIISLDAQWLCPKMTIFEGQNFHNFLEKTAQPFHQFVEAFKVITGLELELDEAKWNHWSNVEEGKFISKAFCTMSYILKSSTHHIELCWDWENRQVEIFIVAVRNQGKGEGTYLMEICKTLSLRLGIGIRLCPIEHITSWGTLTDQDKLKNWYLKLGFTPEENSFYLVYNV